MDKLTELFERMIEMQSSVKQCVDAMNGQKQEISRLSKALDVASQVQGASGSPAAAPSTGKPPQSETNFSKNKLAKQMKFS